MTIRTRPATAAYREGWERTFGRRVVDFDKGPIRRFCALCFTALADDATVCPECGTNVVIKGNRYTSSITFGGK